MVSEACMTICRKSGSLAFRQAYPPSSLSASGGVPLGKRAAPHDTETGCFTAIHYLRFSQLTALDRSSCSRHDFYTHQNFAERLELKTKRGREKAETVR